MVVLSKCAWVVLLIAALGCSQRLLTVPDFAGLPNGIRSSQPQFPNRPITNPLTIPDADPEFVWNQLVDTVDDYFRIDFEQRMIRTGDQWIEGEIVTFPEIGATFFEPWHKHSTNGFQRLQSTLQTIRRTCRIRIMPEMQGYSVSVIVNKDLEDVDRSQYSSDGGATERHDGSVVRTDPTLQGQPITLGWIEQERDDELEQRILREFLGRVTNVAPPRRRWFHHR